MENIINTTILGLFFGTIGTTVGGIIGCTIKNTSNKFLSFILSFAAGLMMSVICFDLIPEALEISNITQTIIGIILGIIAMIFCDVIVDKKFNTRKIDTNIASNALCNIIWNCNRNWCIDRRYYRKNIRTDNIIMPKLCGWGDALYSIWRACSRI